MFAIIWVIQDMISTHDREGGLLSMGLQSVTYDLAT